MLHAELHSGKLKKKNPVALSVISFTALIALSNYLVCLFLYTLSILSTGNAETFFFITIKLAPGTLPGTQRFQNTVFYLTQEKMLIFSGKRILPDSPTFPIFQTSASLNHIHLSLKLLFSPLISQWLLLVLLFNALLYTNL